MTPDRFPGIASQKDDPDQYSRRRGKFSFDEEKYIGWSSRNSISGGEIVPAGKGDGQMREVLDFLRYHEDMFVTLEPHLAEAGSMRGFSGEELFGIAHKALVGILDELGIKYS